MVRPAVGGQSWAYLLWSCGPQRRWHDSACMPAWHAQHAMPSGRCSTKVPARLPLWQGLKTKDARFACRERAALLSTLYRGVELAVARGSCGLGPTVLG